MKYPLIYESWSKAEAASANRVLRSKKFTIGKETASFESEFAKRMGVKFAVMTCSGSSANLLSVAALRFKEKNPLRAGDEVIVPALGWSTSYSPLQQYGLKLRFVDINTETLNIDLAQTRAAITDKTRAILSVNMMGNPSGLPELSKLCSQHKLLFLEDNCESIGAEIGGRKSGTFGDISSFSFFYSHQMHSIEGGMVATNDSDLYEILLSLRSHGWAREISPNSRLLKGRKKEFPGEYLFVLPGYNLRPTELSAAIGRAQLKRLPAFIKQRQKNADHFQNTFAEDKRFICQKIEGKSSWFAFTMIATKEWSISRAKIFSALDKNRIEYRLIAGGNFLRHPAIDYFDYSVYGTTQNADLVQDRGFSMGNNSGDLRRQIDHLKKTLNQL
jgi:CDP-6-deoxy-D-xylo-4-hexulose-3-dehydrase